MAKGKVQRPYHMVQVLVKLFLGSKASNNALFVGAVVQIGWTVLGIDFSLRHGVLWVDWTPWHTCLPCTSTSCSTSSTRKGLSAGSGVLGLSGFW